jgi:ubiquitin-protein ligase
VRSPTCFFPSLLSFPSKRLKQQSPTGVYVLPAADSLRRWYGVIFLRKGHYRGGIFKFVILIPQAYPDEGPKVHFLSEVFHPLIHPDTGLLDLSWQFPVWSSNQHYIVLLLCYIKKIFYKTEYWEGRPPGSGASPKDAPASAMNPKAQSLWLKSPAEYLKMCEQTSAKSQTAEKLYSTPEDAKMSIKFDRPRPAHEEACRRIVHQEKERGVAGASYLDWFTDGVYKLDNLSLGPVPTMLPPVTYNASSSSASHPAVTVPSSSSSTSSASADLLGPMSPISPLVRAKEAKEAANASEQNAMQSPEQETDQTMTVTMEPIQ